MYYNKVLPKCQLLFASSVTFKQQAAEEVQAPCLEQSDLFESKQLGHQPVPQPHGGKGEQQAKGNKDPNDCNNGSGDVFHYFTFLIS
jgi:hypothetical protein